MKTTVNVVGLGYIGLPTAFMLASHGVSVIGTDYNKERVRELQRGELSFEEEGLNELFAAAKAGGIQFSEVYVPCENYIICVPTPYEKVSKRIDASYMTAAIKEVLPVCPKGATIIVESTISPGTIDYYVRPVLEQAGRKIGEDIHLAHAPERIIPGNMIQELLHNNRTIGADSKEVGQRVKEMYQSFCQGQITITDIRTAEMTKVVENTFRDINIAFANELACICHSQNLDVYEIIKIANQHPRVNILSPGPGVGGHCIPVDPWFLVGDCPEETRLIRTAREINDSMPQYVLTRISEVMRAHGLKDISRVGFYGLTYKADVNDMRESPTLQILEFMKNHLGGEVQVYDPMIPQEVTEHQHHSLESFLESVDLVVILVDHQEILQKMDCLKGKVILDTRHVCHLDGVSYL